MRKVGWHCILNLCSVDDLDPAERFGTTAELLDRRCNRLPVARLQSADVQVEDKATALVGLCFTRADL